MEPLPTPKTLQQAIEFFSDPDRCHAYMVQMRWPDGVVICPICNEPNRRLSRTGCWLTLKCFFAMPTVSRTATSA